METLIASELTSADYDNPSSECDMVMKGGITSGVIYPLAVCRLAIEHRLRNIGGASAGAIAAGLAAAAEYARYDGGYRRLAEIPEKVGTHLDSLFQPTRQTRPAMQVLRAALKPTNRYWRIIGTVGALVQSRFLWCFFGLVVVVIVSLVNAMITIGPPDNTAWQHLLRGLVLPIILLAVPTGIVAGALGLFRVVWNEIPRNYFGLSHGMTTEPNRGDALTPWIHKEIQRIAGRNHDGAPLTFGDLWGTSKMTAAGDDKRHIRLEVMTTDLTEGMPYRIPFDSSHLAFCPKCFANLFPTEVVRHMKTAGRDVVLGDDGTAVCRWCRLHNNKAEPLRGLPEPESLPILVAVRMSLSFPVLISAIPLHKRDLNRKQGKRNWACHWFSDGGIGSNFPIHFFDSPWPRRPTFGVDLQPTHPDYPNSEFYLHRHGHTAHPRTLPIASVMTFLVSIIHTMLNWHDRSLAQSRGYADRVLKIHLGKGEGGMNLRMRPPDIRKLAQRGGQAAKEFARFDMKYHKWARYRVAMAELDELLTDLRNRYDSGYEQFIRDHVTSDYVPPGGAWRDRDRSHTQELMEVARDWIRDGHSAKEEAPSPRPMFRMEARQIESQ